jgi:cell division protein ZapD
LITYEYPFNELVRSLLRLEYLFDRFNYYVEKDDARDMHQAISIIFDLGEVTARADLKSSLMKELDRQRHSLELLKNQKGVDQSILDSTLAEMNVIWNKINNTIGKPNSLITDSEWLNAIRTRLSVPGGTSPVDLPSYHAWQFIPATTRRASLKAYMAPLQPWSEASSMFLRLLRESCQDNMTTAPNGAYQQMLSGKTYQLMRIHVEDPSIIPEISANKYMLWIRFMECDGVSKPKPLSKDYEFKMSLCNF